MPAKAAESYGPLVLANPSKAEVDIILVHGLEGHREATWTSTTANPCFWPQDFLTDDLPSARIITWGYPAITFKLAEVVAILNPTQIANNLCTERRAQRVDCEDRPLIFVVHSMGGIVVQKALLHSFESTSDIASVADGTCGIVFVGTPHCGSGKADFASFSTSIVKFFHPAGINDTLIQGLRSQNSELQDLQRRFNQLLIRRKEEKTDIEVQCFCETMSMSGVGGIGGLVVPTYSAAPPTCSTPIAVTANHINMTKFSSREDRTYQNILAELKRMIKLVKERRGDDTDPKVQKGSVTHIGNNNRGALANYGSQSIGGRGGSTHYGRRGGWRTERRGSVAFLREVLEDLYIHIH